MMGNTFLDLVDLVLLVLLVRFALSETLKAFQLCQPTTTLQSA
jgi:hypothetical protein